MGSTPSPYDAAIEELEGQIRHLQSILDSLKILRTGPDGSPLAFSSSPTRDADTEIRHDTFFGMTIADAARKYLGMVKQTKSTADIAEALERGGLKHASKDFAMTVRAVISPREEFVRVNSDWGLTEWYPGMRDKKAKVEKKVKVKKHAKGRKTTAKAKSAAPDSEAKGSAEKPDGKDSATKQTIEQKIMAVMRADPKRTWMKTAMAKATDLKPSSVQSLLSVMAKAGKINKAEKGYRLDGAAKQTTA